MKQTKTMTQSKTLHSINRPNKQKGFSAWLLLPWLLFITLAAIFWWFITIREPSQVETLPEPTNIVPEATHQPVAPVSPQASAMPVVSYHDSVLKASVSVVNIYTTQKINNPYADDPMFRQFLEFHGYDVPQNGETNLGSGVIVSQDGYIITNAHVIDKADEIVVVLNDGRKAKATIIGTDKDSDLAVIKVELTGLSPINFKTEPVQVGDVTLAIGNPFGVGQTVTQGIVSATGRTGLGMNTFEDFIQTDAAINPGNSGGALVDAYGDLIGINTMIYSRSGGSMGIGFAIPNEIVQKVMNDIIKTGKVSRGWLGIEIGRSVADPTSLENSTGVVVSSVMPDAPAAKAGLLVGDVIKSIDGVTMKDGNELISYVARQAPNSTLSLEIERQGAPMTLSVVLAERPQIQ